MKQSREHRMQLFEALKKDMKTFMPFSQAQYVDLSTTVKSANCPPQRIECFPESANHTIARTSNPLVLVFGSAHKPGGGVLTGATAQEEDISLSTSWYFHVKDCDQFYKKEHKNLLYSDLALYVKDALLFRDAYGQPITATPISLIGAAAPNLNGMKKSNNVLSDKIIYDTLERRIDGVLGVAQKNNHPTLIVGAWGCGVFHLDPHTVAQTFKKCLNKKLYGGTVLFSIMDPQMCRVFESVLHSPAQKMKV